MKKILQKVGTAILTIPLLILFGCKAPEYSSETDTVLTLETPGVSGKAYPGVNYVYWDKVANAKNGYHLDVYENGVLINNQSKDFDEDTTYLFDTDLQNGVAKTYKVSAIGDSQARALYYTESGKGAVTLNAIVPPINTSAINLALYENGYDPNSETAYEFTDDQKALLLSEDTIQIVLDEDSENFSVSFPVKPYLSYKIYAEYGNDYEMFGKHTASSLVAEFENIAYKNNDTATVTASVPVSGDYTIYVKASSINKKYPVSDEIVAKDALSYSTLDLSTSYAALINDEMSGYTSSTSAAIYWTPAKLLDGSYVPADYYKIYKSVAGENKYTAIDAAAEEYTSITSTNKIYYFEDTDLNSSKNYTYRLVITDGEKYAQIYTEVSVSAYRETIVTGNETLRANYISDDTARIIWAPDVIKGKTLSASDYKLYVKDYYAADTEYTLTNKKILSGITQSNTTVYYVDEAVTDTTSTYAYLLTYESDNIIYQSTTTLMPYTKAVVLSTPTVTFVANDTDGIANDAEIKLSVSDEQVINEVKYIELESSITEKLLDKDYKNALNVADADETTEDGITTYTWTVSDIEEGNYVSVAAIVDKNAAFATTEYASASEPEFTTSTENSGLSIDFIDSDDDGLKDDAFVIVTLADDDKLLSKVVYGAAASLDDVELSSELEISSSKKYRVYAFTIKDAVSPETSCFVVEATISEEGKKDAVITNNAIYTKNTSDISVLSLAAKNSDDDGLYNDIYLAILANETQKVSITYAISNTAENAKTLLDSSEAKTLAENLTGYSFYEFSSDKYEALKDIPLDKYFAVRITGTEAGVTIDTVVTDVTADATYDAYADLETDEPILNMKKIAADEDGIVNDIYATVELYNTQTLENLIYTTSTDADISEAEILRLFSSNAADITNKKTLKYSTADKNIYEVLIKDFDAETTVAVMATAGETGKINKSAHLKETVTAEEIVLTKTQDIYADQNALYFYVCDNDSKYNDIKKDTIHFTIGIDQSIKSIRWAEAETIDAAKELLRTDSTAANKISIPTTYQLNTSVTNNVSTLTKTYTVQINNDTPSMNNISDGNIVLLSVITSEPGYLDDEIFMSTEGWTYISYYPYEEINIPEYSWERPVTATIFTADDSKNYEYVHVTISDLLNWDIPEEYTYKLERTYEDTYNDSDAVWETIENQITLNQDWSTGYYTAEKWYTNIPVGKYVYRLTKTRNSSGEKVTADEAVNVIYNVEAPALSFSLDNSGNMILTATEYIDPYYDSFDKYDYELTYMVSYNNSYISNFGEITGWSWEPGDAVGYYILNSNIISELKERYSPSAANVNVYITITKTRKLDESYTDTESTSLQMNWNPSVTIASGADITISNCYEATTISEDYVETTYLVLKADTAYDSYTWYVDYTEQSDETEAVIAINKNDLYYGTHTIQVSAEKNNVTYSTTISYTKSY